MTMTVHRAHSDHRWSEWNLITERGLYWQRDTLCCADRFGRPKVAQVMNALDHCPPAAEMSDEAFRRHRKVSATVRLAPIPFPDLADAAGDGPR